MLYKATKPGLVSVLYLSMRYTVLLFISPLFTYGWFSLLCVLSFGCSGLSYQYLPRD